MSRRTKMQLRYPAAIWTVFPLLAIASQFESILGFVLLSMAIIAGSAILWRNKFLHPLGQTGYPYYHWLRTTPYTPDQPLPNGSVMPGWEDALFIIGLLVASAMTVDFHWTMTVMCWGALINLVVLLFSFITLRDLFNVGPRWMAYVIALCILLAFQSAWFMLESKTHWELGLLAPIPAFIASVVGLHLMMKRYPWNDTPPPNAALVSNMTFKHMQNNYSDVTATGQPFTSLKPDGRWPKVPQADAVAASVLLAFAAYVLKAGDWSSIFLLFELLLLVCSGRLMLYGTGKRNFLTVNALRRDMQSGHLSQSLLASALLIIFSGLVALGILNLIPLAFPYQAKAIVGILTPVFAGLLCYMTIKLPPSRQTWETVGRWQASNDADYDTQNKFERSKQ